jgi:methionyl-tRNA formyltransferase
VKCIIASQLTSAARRLVSLLTDLSPENEWELRELSADHLPDADFIFLFRWPFIISDKVRSTTRAKIVVFHTSELPKGRGGSPIQNQILEGKYTSRVNAIEMKKGVDSGGIYASQDVTLQGTADDVWMAIAHASCRLAIKVIEGAQPLRQEGEPSLYRRRRDNALPSDGSQEQVHRFIQMLDGEGYPNAHLDYGNLRITFSRSSLRDGHILCDAVITQRIEDEDISSSSSS